MLYYKNLDGDYYTSSSPITREGMIEVTEQEYRDFIEELKLQEEPTEEEIRAEKEAQLTTLLNDLYPEQAQQEAFLINSLTQVYNVRE